MAIIELGDFIYEIYYKRIGRIGFTEEVRNYSIKRQKSYYHLQPN